MSKAKKKAARSLRMGALVVLSACFVASAILRAGEVVAELPAGGDDGFGNPLPSATGGAATSATNSASPGEAATGGPTPSELMKELQRQREGLAAREAEIAAREQTLRALDKRLNSRLEEMRAAREKLEQVAALVDDAAGKDVRRLAEMYQQMKPKQAGQIFNAMAPSFAAGFIAEMRPDAAALIMANMEADKAYAVSLLIAGRNVQAPAPVNAQAVPAAEQDAAGQEPVPAQ